MLRSKEDLSSSRGNMQFSIFASTARQRPVLRRRHEGYFILLMGRSQDDSRLRAVFSVSPPLQVPLPSDCRFHCRRAGMGNPYSPWHAGMIVSCNYQKMRCSWPRTLCRTTVFAIHDSTNLANEHHPMEVGSIDFAARQPVTSIRCPAPKPRHLQDPSA